MMIKPRFMDCLNPQYPSLQVYLDSRYGEVIENHNKDIKFHLKDTIHINHEVNMLMSIVDL